MVVRTRSDSYIPHFLSSRCDYLNVFHLCFTAPSPHLVYSISSDHLRSSLLLIVLLLCFPPVIVFCESLSSVSG